MMRLFSVQKEWFPHSFGEIWRETFWIERLTVCWWLVTTLGIAVLWRWLGDPMGMMLRHTIIAVCVLGAWLVGRRLHSAGLFIRVAVPLLMLALWYGDTYSFCSLFSYKDDFFASLDQWLFGCQPSIVFGEALKDGIFVGASDRTCGVLLPEGLFSELFNMGYYSYFYMQLAVMVYYFIRCRDEFACAGFIVLCSFFAFYVIYMLLPVAGPQYYFDAIGLDLARMGLFPEVGSHFAVCRDMLPAPGWADGLFYRIIASTQATGEFPTAAFPSSHIGCTVVFLGLALRRSRILFCCLLPFAVLLAFATVYIQAHYLVDVIAGLLFGLVVYFLLIRTVRLHLL